MAERPFYQLNTQALEAGGRLSAAQRAELEALDRQAPDEQGALRARFVSWPTPLAWGLMLAPAAACGLLAGVAALGAPQDPLRPLLLVLAAAVLLVAVAVLVALGAMDAHEVRQHGLVLGWGRRRRVVPWATVDPGRVHCVDNLNLAGRYFGLGATHRARGFALHTPGVIVNGWSGQERRAWEGAVGAVQGSPFAPWFIATRQPEAFVQALEAAMVADGYPAQGLAAGAISRRVRLRWADSAARRAELALRLGPPRRLQDPVLGVVAPAPRR